MYGYNHKGLVEWMRDILQLHLNQEELRWVDDNVLKIQESNKAADLYKAFTAAPRVVGKKTLSFKNQSAAQCPFLKDVSLTGFTTDRLTRVLLLLSFSAEDKDHYFKVVEQLFKAAEMNELVALYGALPFLPYPEDWQAQCAEGIRSNIDLVLEAIMCDNPYPNQYLSEPAWNQLVLKALFTGKDINRIIGLDERANQNLAYAVSDYAHERWAAGRDVNPLAWRLTAKHIDLKIFPDIIKLFKTGTIAEQQAAALACSQCSYAPAKALLEAYPDLQSDIQNNKITWNSISLLNKISV